MNHFVEVKNHNNYLINEKGEVYNRKTNHKLKHSLSGTGYYTVYVDKKNHLLHRLLAETFIPNPKNLPCVNHIDGNKLNNELSNLEWCTHAENNKHAYSIGLKKWALGKGEQSTNHKLSQSDVDYIQKELQEI